MALSKRIREDVRKKLGISSRQLLRRVNSKALEAGVANRDIALLILAHETQIDVTKPRYQVPPYSIEALETFLAKKSGNLLSLAVPVSNPRKGPKEDTTRSRRLIRFKGKYPEIFYNGLEDEINIAYSNPRLPNAVLMLSRKLIENLAFNLLQYKFKGPGVTLYYDTKNKRPLDFGVLLDNLKAQKAQFDSDLHDSIDKFLQLAQPFRRDANSKAHNVMEYLESTAQLKKLKIPEMTQLLLRLIDRAK